MWSPCESCVSGVAPYATSVPATPAGGSRSRAGADCLNGSKCPAPARAETFPECKKAPLRRRRGARASQRLTLEPELDATGHAVELQRHAAVLVVDVPD